MGYDSLNLDLGDFKKLLNKDDFEEHPVDLREFVMDPYYLGLPRLSELQYEIATRMSQVYNKETLIELYGPVLAKDMWEKTVNEVICEIGKGGGKDFTIKIAFCYIIYQLHCLRDPLNYYKKGGGEYIDLLNIALNADQAKNVFFDPMKNILVGSPYFQEQGMEIRSREIIFHSRPVRCFSGHSGYEGWEGYNLIAVVLDEIAAFKTDSELAGEKNKYAASTIYSMSKNSVISRFPDVGKVALLSFPRYEGDFIEERYEKSVADKKTTKRSKIIGEYNDEQIEIHWDEDEIFRYSFPGVWALKCPSWYTNPERKPEDYFAAYLDNPIETAAKFFCVDEETEILTDNGWKNYNELSVGENALSLNHDTGLSEWKPISDIHIYPAKPRRMLKMEGTQHSSLTTLDHRWPVIRLNRGDSERTWTTSKELRCHEAIPVAAPCSDLPTQAKYDDSFVELMAWAWTEGSIYNRSGLRIYQSHKVNYENCVSIRSALTRLYGNSIDDRFSHISPQWREKDDAATGMTTFFLNKEASQAFWENMNFDKVIHPSFVMSLTAAQLTLFIQKSIDADGWRGNGRRRWGQRLLERNKIFEMACALLGLRTNTSFQIDERWGFDKFYYSTSILKHNQIKPKDSSMINAKFSMDIVEHDGVVWCPTLPNNAWLARRRGTVFYTGNCMPPKAQQAYFRDPDRVRQCFPMGDELNPMDEFGQFKDWFKADRNADKSYWVHIDLGLTRDRAALCMVHCAGSKRVQTFDGVNHISHLMPIIKMDVIKYWQAPMDGEIDFNDVRGFAFELANRFPIALISMDRWESHDTSKIFQSRGLSTEMHVVDKKDYDTLSTSIYDGRLIGYYHDILVDGELLKLQLERGKKVDHPKRGFKDGSDCLAGATYYCTQYTPIEEEVEIAVLGDYEPPKTKNLRNTKQPEQKEMPVDLEEYLRHIQVF